MVCTTLVNCAKRRCVGPDRFWRRRKFLRVSAHFYGRRRNCYRIAAPFIHKSWMYLTKSRTLKKKAMKELWISRLTAACEENKITYKILKSGLIQLNVLLNNKVLTDLAIWEPRTFKSLAKLTLSVNTNEEGLNGINNLSDPPPGVFTRNLLKK